MKKKRRDIIIGGYPFSWVVNETTNHIKIRCYSMKSTYVEIILNWDTTAWWAVNYYQPSVVATMIEYAMRLGWKYQLEKQVMIVPADESEKWIEDAGIIDYAELNQYLLENGYHIKI